MAGCVTALASHLMLGPHAPPHAANISEVGRARKLAVPQQVPISSPLAQTAVREISR